MRKSEMCEQWKQQWYPVPQSSLFLCSGTITVAPSGVLPSLVHLCVSPVVFSRAPAMAAKRWQWADAASEKRGAPRHLCHPIFGFFCFSSSSTSNITAWSYNTRSPSLHWAPAAFQPLAAVKAGAGWTYAGSVVCGGTWHGNLAGAVSSCCYWLVMLLRSTKNII